MSDPVIGTQGDLAGDLKNQMGFTPNKRRIFKNLKGTPPFKVAYWKSLPSFVVKYNTKIIQGEDKTIYNVLIEITKTKDSDVADISFQGHKFGELHVGNYKAGEEMRHGPNFVPRIDAETRKRVLGGHITPWCGIMPANIFSKNAFNAIMQVKFPADQTPVELFDPDPIRLQTVKESKDSE